MGVHLCSSRHALLLALVALSFFFVLYYLRTEEQLSRLARVTPAASSLSPSPREDSNDDVIIFNRIPKTASTTFMHVPYELCAANDFHVLLVNITRQTQHYLTFQDILNFARNITQWKEKRPALYHGHFAFVDFDRLGASNPRPVYINLVRRPLDRLVSYYYFLRYGDDYRINKIRSKMGDKMTFDECVRDKLPDCDPKKLWMQIPWFCGSFRKCWEPGNRWALEQAKHNLVHKYFLVGQTEDLDTFFRLLELSLPRFFAGATDLFRRSGNLSHIRKTKHKEEPSEDTVKIMQQSKVWKLENEFYEFAVSQFSWVKAELEATGGGNFFQYEKIRPRS